MFILKNKHLLNNYDLLGIVLSARKVRKLDPSPQGHYSLDGEKDFKNKIRPIVISARNKVKTEPQA